MFDGSRFFVLAGIFLALCSQIREYKILHVFGETTITTFAKKNPRSRRSLARFLSVSRAAEWPCFPAFKESFATADYAHGTGTIIFNIGRNKYWLIARVDFDEQTTYVESVLTHEEYETENF